MIPTVAVGWLLISNNPKGPFQTIDLADSIYETLQEHISVGRYHSWAVNLSSNKHLITTAIDQNNIVMSFRHITFPVYGIQYHPESVLTEYGAIILKNWLKY